VTVARLTIPPLGYRFRHSHGGTGLGAAYRSLLASLALSPTWCRLVHTFATTSPHPFSPLVIDIGSIREQCVGKNGPPWDGH